MNNQNEKNTENIVEQALQYIDDGKTPTEIFALFPDHRTELEEIFFAINVIQKEGKEIYPDKEVFKRVMSRIPASVTFADNRRYSIAGEVHTRARSSRPRINYLTEILNPMNWKMIAPVGVVAVIAFVLVGVNQSGTKLSQSPIANREQVQETSIMISQDLPVASPERATGNIDETVNTILASVLAEESYIADAVKDSELLTADSQSIADFNQLSYENEF